MFRNNLRYTKFDYSMMSAMGLRCYFQSPG